MINVIYKKTYDSPLGIINMKSDGEYLTGLWFDGSRAMKVITNTISHKIDAKYIVPTKINMEDGLLEKIVEERND